jgi:hypothetical protein
VIQTESLANTTKHSELLGADCAEEEAKGGGEEKQEEDSNTSAFSRDSSEDYKQSASTLAGGGGTQVGPRKTGSSNSKFKSKIREIAQNNQEHSEQLSEFCLTGKGSRMSTTQQEIKAANLTSTFKQQPEDYYHKYDTKDGAAGGTAAVSFEKRKSKKQSQSGKK